MDKEAIKQVINAIPEEWHGTTFKNHNLLGREGFSSNLNELLKKKESSNESITTEDLENLGNAEDYLRVATNIATTLEVFLARQKNLSIDQVFTFSSNRMPIISVLLSIEKNTPVHLFTGSNEHPFNDNDINILKTLGCNIKIHSGNYNDSNDDNNTIILSMNDNDKNVDGIINDNILFINNTDKINPSKILIIRKRTTTPITSPMAISKLYELAELKENDKINGPSNDELNELYFHLQELSGTEKDENSKPVICTAGLPTIASLWITLISKYNGVDVLMASTAYGGSSQLADIMNSRAEKSLFRKHTFDIQGVETEIIESIKTKLDDLSNMKEKLNPITVLFVEVPTNPDMKVPNVNKLANLLDEYKEKITSNGEKRDVLLLVDTTFAPGSKVMDKIKNIAHEIPVMVFISLSKSVSRGITTAGCVVSNHTSFSINLLKNVNDTANMLDSIAKDDQLKRLSINHHNVEKRCDMAYKAALECGNHLKETVKKNCNGYDMPLAFPKPEEAEIGFTSSTFSFNLPSLPNGSQKDNEELAQKFVDLLCRHKEFKPCVSFGQDNSLVYATVPATSTQGAIKEEDKAKQAVGGVQLVRLSFAPTIDIEKVKNIIEESVISAYA